MFPIQVMKLKKAGVQALVNIFDTTARRATTTTATATYHLGSDGVGSSTNTGGSVSTWNWLLVGLNSDYQVRATYVSGDTPSGTLGSWLSLGTSRDWSLTQSVTGILSGVIFVEIRRVVDSVVVGSANITITATVS